MKKMHKTLALAIVFMTLASIANGQSFVLDTQKSQLEWIGRKVTGQHNGTLKLESGTIELDGKSVKSGQFKIDMKSLTVLDLKDPEMNGKLTNHLMSDDFFSVAKHPFAILDIKRVESKDNDHSLYQVKGDLTIKGIKNDISFPATIVELKDGYHAHGELTLDRTRWDIRFRSGKFFENLGDKLIYDDFDVKLDLNFVPKTSVSE